MHETEMLMITGPVEIHPRVLREMGRPAIPHYHPSFYRAFDETCEVLKTIFKTKNDIILLPGSGRISIESSILSVLEPGDPVLCIENGVFGSWLLKMAERVGGDVTRLQQEWGKPLDLELVRRTLLQKNFKLLAIVHSESSTGAKNPIEEVGKICRLSDALYLVDSVSSLGGMNIEVDQWGIDFCCAGSQKCLAAPMGISIVSVSDRAWESMERRKRKACSWSLDLLRWRQQYIGKEAPKPFPVNPPTHLVYALKEACKMVLEEGLDNRFLRHKWMRKTVRGSVEQMGLELFTADENIASDTITAILLPNGIESDVFVSDLRTQFGINITGGLFPGLERVVRIGHMGTVDLRGKILFTLQALFILLSRQDIKVSDRWMKGIDLLPK